MLPQLHRQPWMDSDIETFRDQVRRYIAADVECIFGNAPRADCPGQMLSPTHFVIERRWYKLDLQIVEAKPGPQPAEMFEALGITPP